jgi:hypothetical protein
LAITKKHSSTLKLLAAEYQRSLKNIESFARSLSGNTQKCSTPTQYRRLIKSRISEYFNDASLCIRAIHCEKEAIYSEKLTESDAKAIDDAARGTIAFLGRLIRNLLPDSILAQNNVESTLGVYDERALNNHLETYSQIHGPRNEEVHRILLGLVRQLNASFKLVALHPNRRYTYHLYRWSSILLSLAMGLEMLLGNLATKISWNRGLDSAFQEKFVTLSISD